ncbi:MAG TPA: DUF3786 domain-containing protein [Desulfotomaculum sp.]|nr:MAG: hypothetical protein JL56_06085 [Desulfotomaculum sp. BICA1-6]HBX24235.1 DUF3786 domain-containing protein [Desulfotomaculum sp.]
MNEPQAYMIGKAKIGHYKSAFDKSLKIFSSLDPLKMAARSGSDYNPATGMFTVNSFGREISVSYPDGCVTFRGTTLLPIMGWRLVILNYLGRADGTPLLGQEISYRELEDGMVFFNAFQRESIYPLGKWIAGKSPAIVGSAITKLGGTDRGDADISAVFQALPRFPVHIKLWFPDEELPGSANILFDSSANRYLHTEDIAAVGGYAAAFLIKEYQVRTGKQWRQITL